jgi:hypothetical protein
MLRFGKAIACILLATCATAFADSKEPSEYPLIVTILRVHWDSDRPGGAVGTGYGNVQDGDSVRGFYYVCNCGGWLAVTENSDIYNGKWKKRGARLEIIGSQSGDADKRDRCELRVSMQNHVYLLKDGQLVKATLEQWKQMEKLRANTAGTPSPE